jgi:hypothetical protein
MKTLSVRFKVAFTIYLGKCVPDPTREVRSVSFRKVNERRGSWPLAYKNVTVQEDY